MPQHSIARRRTGRARAAAIVLLRAAAVLMLLLGGYVLAGTIGGMIPANPGWHPPAQGVVIFVESNGIHTGLVLPKRAAGVDWTTLFPARDLADPRYGRWNHVAIGWGEQRFFLDTPTWRDVRPGTILAAAIGSDATLLHVEHVPPPVGGRDERRIVLTPDEYRRLAGFIVASLAPIRRTYRGYGADDVFYQARGHYSGLRTCNSWTGEALRHAGVRVGAWTPFPDTVLHWF